MRDFIFTFGFGHTDPVTGESRSGMFTRIRADDSEHARERMNCTFGRQWAFQYESEAEAGVAKYGLVEVAKSQIPPELIAVLESIYKPEGVRIWWGAPNYSLDSRRPVDVWRESPAVVLAAAESLLSQVAS